ncbi:MAG: Lrp/AsnC family transcriptional regulator [Candidatus Lokiarchaeota archaeon]
MTSTNQLKLDYVDKKIMNLLQKNPNLTHEQIANRINRSQPTVGLRLKKLLKSNIFHIQPGVNMKEVELTMGMVKIKTDKSESAIQMAKTCPYILNAFKLSGKFNVLFLIIAPDLKSFEKIINKHFRATFPNVTSEIIIDSAKDFVVPIEFNLLRKRNLLKPEECTEKCKICLKFKNL